MGIAKLLQTPENVSEGYWPFYKSNDERNHPMVAEFIGYADNFMDAPARDKTKPFIQTFEGELTLVELNNHKMWTPLITFSYGFSLSPDGGVMINPLRIISMYPNSFSGLSLNQNSNIFGGLPRNIGPLVQKRNWIGH